MREITPTTPSFVFGYWRPWNEGSDYLNSYLDYNRDLALRKYGSDIVGDYISKASREQVEAINELGEKIGLGMNYLSGKLESIADELASVNTELFFIKKNLDIQIEQQRLTNILLKDIAELLRVPDSEKVRQHCIEMGVKFFVNAKKDPDLYADALEELLKAEELEKQDYFVLHRIGSIYLYAEKLINPEEALDYFLRAAKYAIVESDPSAIRLANILTHNFDTVNTESNTNFNGIQQIASESYEKAAFAAYVIGDFQTAVKCQKKVLEIAQKIYSAYIEYEVVGNNADDFDVDDDSDEYQFQDAKAMFLLAKYQIRNNDIDQAIENLNKAIPILPSLALGVFKEIDLLNEPRVIDLIKKLDEEANKRIDEHIVYWSKDALLSEFELPKSDTIWKKR